MKWTEVPKTVKEITELGDGEVLGKTEFDQMMVGKLLWDGRGKFFVIEHNRQCLEKITHYISKDDILKLEKND